MSLRATPEYRPGRRSRKVRGISDADRAMFTAGQCHILAYAIQARTGWPIWCGTFMDGKPDLHAFVVMPNGKALDVRGMWPSAQKCIAEYSCFAGCRHFWWYELQACGWVDTEPRDPAVVSRAKRVAHQLLSMVGSMDE
jgi:hypothetical protein